MAAYNPVSIEKKWQKRWLENRIFASRPAPDTPPFYVLDMFPYPSGEGLHVGHPEGYTATDILARYKRARGFAVMHPMGWDAFGLPAEQYAIKTDTHPGIITKKNIDRFRGQLQSIGFSYDWEREINTTDPAYFRWTQWIFLKLYDTWFDPRTNRGRPIQELAAEFASGARNIPAELLDGHAQVTWSDLNDTQRRKVLAHYRLAYEVKAPVNWCPALGTVLANEEVIDGKSEVGGFPVERRPMRQWMLRITAYAQRLLDGLDTLEWSDSLKLMQRNWIGRSDGAQVHFHIAHGNAIVTVFTTRPDTLFGATYMVLAPEHPLADVQVSSTGENSACLIPDHWPANTPDSWKYNNAATPREAVRAYQNWTSARSERQRQEDTAKTGAFTGLFAVNPVNGRTIPIFISDYVLMGYGSGAIMAVPGHDRRDFAFAGAFGLPVESVVAESPDQQSAAALPFEDNGYAVNSPWINGLSTEAAREKMIELLEKQGLGRLQINYKIRDWLFSRQRYWGEPFPIVHLPDGTHAPLADSELPLELPPMSDFKPTGTMDPPLSKAAAWRDIQIVLESPHGAAGSQTARLAKPDENGIPARREINTMPQWAGSCWYYLRYLDPHNNRAFCDPQMEKYWMHGRGVDLYIGGVEHAVLHLLYSRFWHKVLYDLGYVSSDEPFQRLVNQGLILGEAEYTLFTDESGVCVSLEDVAPDWDSRPGPDGRAQVISQSRITGKLLIGCRCRPDEVEKRGEGFVLKRDPAITVDTRSFKMSKSRGNVVNPDDVIRDFGADSLRLFEMFMGPLEQVKPWSTAGVEGVYRFLQRVWRNLNGGEDPCRVVYPEPDGGFRRNKQPATGLLNPDQNAEALADARAIVRPMHRTIRKVTGDIERLAFNTAISSLMEFNNVLSRLKWIPEAAAMTMLRLLEPLAPHIAEELYEQLALRTTASISLLPWPDWDETLCTDAELDLPVQINGKLSGRVKVPNDADADAVVDAAMRDAGVQAKLAGRPVKKPVYVQGRMLNLVV